MFTLGEKILHPRLAVQLLSGATMATALLGLVLMAGWQAGGFGVYAASWDISVGVPALRAERCFCFQIKRLDRYR